MKQWKSGVNRLYVFYLLCDYQAQAMFSLCFWFFSFPPSSLTRSLHLSSWLGWCSRVPAQLCNFIHVYFTDIFLSIFSPEHFPSHYSAFPLQRYAVFNLPFVSRFLAWGSEYNNYVRFFFFFFIICCILTHATKFILEIDQGLKKKKVALHINI